MNVASVVLYSSNERRARRVSAARRSLRAVARAADLSGAIEAIVVLDDEALAAGLLSGPTVLIDESGTTEIEALRVAIDWCAREGHDGIVVAYGLLDRGLDRPFAPGGFSDLSGDGLQPIKVHATDDPRAKLVFLDASIWPAVPLAGTIAAFLEANEPLTETVVGDSERSGTLETGTVRRELEMSDDFEDRAVVEKLLGRRAMGPFTVVVRDRSGAPMVIENGPFLDDGTPMPTRYWLVDKVANREVGRLEADGGVLAAEQAVDPDELDGAHRRYGEGRDGLIDVAHLGPRPSGGVGGTRRGVKCLHAHFAAYLAGTGDPVGRWVAARIAGVDGSVGAIDCGTNSTRLLITDANGTPLARRTTITRLGDGVDEHDALDVAAIGRTVDALRSYREAMDAFGVVRARAVATSAVRDAANRELFFEQGASVLGFSPELLSGEEEGTLAYLGATEGLDGSILVIDLGGGSTELIAGNAGSVVAVRSLPLGCVRMSERFLLSDPPTSAEIASCRAYVAGVVERALSEAPPLRVPKTVVGVAGTVSSLCALALGLEHYDADRVHHSLLRRDKVESLLAELGAQSLSQRSVRTDLEAGRASVIVGGAAVLAEVLAHLGHEELIHSEHDILDGLARELRVLA